MAKMKQFSPEVRERAVRLVLERQGEHETPWAAIRAIAPKIGCAKETLRQWVRRAERDAGQRPGLTTDERERLNALEREVKELRRANEILRKGSALFPGSGARPPRPLMYKFVDQHRAEYGVEPICRVLQIAPSAYREYAAQQRVPSRQAPRRQRKAELRPPVEAVFDAASRAPHRRVTRRSGSQSLRCQIERPPLDLILAPETGHRHVSEQVAI